jgi:hypothetical protein
VCACFHFCNASLNLKQIQGVCECGAFIININSPYICQLYVHMYKSTIYICTSSYVPLCYPGSIKSCIGVGSLKDDGHNDIELTLVPLVPVVVSQDCRRYLCMDQHTKTTNIPQLTFINPEIFQTKASQNIPDCNFW